MLSPNMSLFMEYQVELYLESSVTTIRIDESCVATVERSLFKFAWNSFVK